jgi:hypothetical protein
MLSRASAASEAVRATSSSLATVRRAKSERRRVEAGVGLAPVAGAVEVDKVLGLVADRCSQACSLVERQQRVPETVGAVGRVAERGEFYALAPAPARHQVVHAGRGAARRRVAGRGIGDARPGRRRAPRTASRRRRHPGRGHPARCRRPAPCSRHRALVRPGVPPQCRPHWPGGHRPYASAPLVDHLPHARPLGLR